MTISRTAQVVKESVMVCLVPRTIQIVGIPDLVRIVHMVQGFHGLLGPDMRL